MGKTKVLEKFYEVGQNRYYFSDINGELFLTTDSVIKQKTRFNREKDFIQNFKMLPLGVPMVVLFEELSNLEILKEDKDFKDMTTYKKLDNNNVHKKAKKLFNEKIDIMAEQMRQDYERNCSLVFELISKEVGQESDEFQETLNKAIEREYKGYKEVIDLIKSDDYMLSFFNLKKPVNCPMINYMLRTNELEYLYGTKINSHTTEHYLYKINMFGTMTVFKLLEVKGKILAIDTFVYDKTIAEELIKYIEGRN